MAIAQGTKITAPKNNYKPVDDVQLGREEATEVSRELPLLPKNGEADKLRRAEKLVESCEHCNQKGAEIPFDNVLDRITSSDPR